MDIDYSDPIAVDKYLAEVFPNIKPTPEEFFKGKISAFETAIFRMEKEKKEWEASERRKVITAPPTYENVRKKALEMLEITSKIEGFEFVLDDDNEKVFHMLCLYFANDKRFEEYDFEGVKYSLKKGIWLQSSTRGTGKSVMLKGFRINKRLCYAYKHITELSELYQKKGYDGIEFFTKLIPQPGSASSYYQQEAGIMYDEMFDDSVVNYMGTPLLLSKYIITSLYDHSHNYKGAFWKFHITSNYDGKEIGEKFGPNVRSRMVEMFNLIKLEGKNRRAA